MELWACGFNAWNQLECLRDGNLSSDPHEIYEFKCILKDERIEILRTSVSAILIRISSGLKVTGSPDEFIKLCSENEGLPNVAIAGNDRLVAFESDALTEYKSLGAYVAKQGEFLRHFGGIKQLVANQTAFTLLSTSGTVYTWGDGRYESCLGRPVSDTCTAARPCLLEDLLDLPQNNKIRSISSGGYVTAALTTSNDLYIWGGRPGQQKLPAQLEGYPTPVDIKGLDFIDVAVGDGHMLALSADHRLFVVGAGENGQLGLGDDFKEVGDWSEVYLPLDAGQKLMGVYAGYKNSFVLLG